MNTNISPVQDKDQAAKKVWSTPKIEVLSIRTHTLGNGAAGPDFNAEIS